MPRDELRQPLRKRSLSERLWAKRPGALATASVVLAVTFAGGAVWLSRIPHPFAGEPVVVAAIPPAEELKTSSTTPDTATEDTAPADEAAETVLEAEEAPPKDYSQEAAIIMAAHRPLKAAPIADVMEQSPDGPLPRVSKQGRKPSDVYAQVTPTAVITSARPKIAILLGGMGINQRLTQKAIKELPGDISFGFAPYGDDLQVQVNKARAKGHEVMLQLPLEPPGYPGINPGPQTLLSDAPEEDNLKSLRWMLSRFAGFTGITNYMGGRFLAVPDSLAPVMKELKKRGLVYLEDGSVAQSTAPAIAQETGLPMRRASMVIDAKPDAESIRAALDELVREAERNGFAIGIGAGLEVTIETVGEFARELQEKGVLLVPISATFKGQMG